MDVVLADSGGGAIGAFGALFLLLYFVAFLALIRWCIIDADKRGISAILVILLVIFLFPIGWLAWLLCRPEEKRPISKKFDINKYRRQ